MCGSAIPFQCGTASLRSKQCFLSSFDHKSSLVSHHELVNCANVCQYVFNSCFVQEVLDSLQLDVSSIYTITKSMRALWLVNQLWFIVPVNSWKFRASSELLYKSNRPQVSMVYRLINHLGCWKNTRRIRKSLACGSWFTNSSSVLPTSRVVYQPINHRNLWYIA